MNAQAMVRAIPPKLAALAERRGWDIRHVLYTYADGTVKEIWEYTDDPVDGPWWEWRE